MNVYEIQNYSLKITYGPESELSWYTVCSQNAVKQFLFDSGFVCCLYFHLRVGIRVWLFASVFLVTSFCVFSLVMVLNSCFIFVATLTAQFFARCFTPCVLLSYPNLWIQFCHLDFSFSLIEDVLGFLFFFYISLPQVCI